MTRDLNEIIEALPEAIQEEYIPEMPGKRKVQVRSAFAASEHMRRMHADPKFARRHVERESLKFKRLNRDPKFTSERLKNLRATMETEEYRDACRQAALKRWAKARGE